MGDDGTDREEMERERPCRCGHSHKDVGGARFQRCYAMTPSEPDGIMRYCSCRHFVPRGIVIPTIGQDHPLRLRRPVW